MENFKLPEIKLSLSYDKKVKKSELFQIRTSKECSEILRSIFNKDTFDWIEEMILLCLSKSNKIVGFYKISSGGTTGTICDPKVVFTVALNCGASSIIIAHNHPSGNIKPSEADITLTKRIKDGGKILDIALLDSVIITDESYYSFADEGILY